MKSLLVVIGYVACILLGMWVIDFITKVALVKYLLIGVLLVILNFICYKIFGSNFIWRQ